jgi:radical SAM protein with 4Fe4S-binding SPASM domain
VTVWYSDNSESYYHPEQMTSWGFNNFEGWTCSAGKAHVNIDCQGKVYPCSTYMDFNLPMGHVSSLSVDDLKARRCKVKHCLCELYLTKTLEGAICQSSN